MRLRQSWFIGVTLAACVAVALVARGASHSTLRALERTASLTVTDGTGSKITVSKDVTRVVALDGSAAVSMQELGLSPKNIAYGSSNKLLIDRVFGAAAKSMTATGGSWEQPNVEDIVAFHPDLVIGDDGEGSIKQALKGVAPLYLVSVGGYRQVLKDFLNFGALTGRIPTAKQHVATFDAAMTKAKKVAAMVSKKPSALIIWGGSPTNFQVPGTADPAASLLAALGTYAMPGENGYSSVSLQTILARNPDVIFVETLTRAADPSAPALSTQLAANPVWGQLKAVKDHRVYEVDPLLWNFDEGNPGGLQQILTQAVGKMYPGMSAGMKMYRTSQ
jgi:iron complex transport system substrate-binding protein